MFNLSIINIFVHTCDVELFICIKNLLKSLTLPNTIGLTLQPNNFIIYLTKYWSMTCMCVRMCVEGANNAITYM